MLHYKKRFRMILSMLNLSVLFILTIFAAIACDPGGGDSDDNGTDHQSDIQGYKILSADGAMFEAFGYSVSISGNHFNALQKRSLSL